ESDVKPQRKIDLAHYIKFRAEEQRDWYRARGARFGKLDARWRAVSVTLAVISIVISIVGSTLKAPAITAIVPIVTTAMAALTSYVIAMRLHSTALIYNVTAFQLGRLLSRPRDASFAVNCEAILLAANTAWMAEWSKKGNEVPTT